MGEVLRMKTGGGERIGYARVSHTSQNLDSQMDALNEAKCSRIFSDKITGTATERPAWDDMMGYLRKGDTIVITELSRMSRSLKHLLQQVDELSDRGVKIVSLREHIDTESPSGRAFLSIMGAIAQMERELKAERAAAGRAGARARGRSGGRPRTPRHKLEQARRLYESGKVTAAGAAKSVGISRQTLFRHLKASATH